MHDLLRRVFVRTAQTLRLMVGVGDYDGYLQHVRQHHPDHKPMTRSDYFHYCQTARYPTRDGEIKRCPC